MIKKSCFQRPIDGEGSVGLLSWVATRWNNKLDSMRRVLELHDAINYVISQKGAQTQSYRLRDDEVACLPGVFLK